MDGESRGQFTFYESFAKALRRIRKKADRADAYDAICDYALYGIEPDLDAMPDAAAIAFDLIKPNLDASKRKAKAGKQGGRKREANGKQNESKEEANGKQEETASEKEKEKENEIEIEKENECYEDDVVDAREAEREERHDLGTVMTLYMDHIQANPPPVHIDTLKSYVQSMGAEVVEHAITKALGANALNFNYVKAVLQGYAQKKVTTLAQAKQVDQDFLESKQRGKGYGFKGHNVQAGSTEPKKIDMDELRAVLDKI